MAYEILVYTNETSQPLLIDVPASGALSIGSDPSCDVILPDAPANWLAIDGAESRIQIMAAIADTEVAGRPAASDGFVALPRFRLPVIKPDLEIALGALQVVVRRQNNGFAGSPAFMAQASRAFNTRNVAKACFGLLACVAVIALAWQTRSTIARPAAPEIERFASARSVAALSSSTGPIPMRQPVATPTTLPLDTQMRHALIRMGVQSPLQVRLTGEGLSLSGKLEAKDAEAMKAVIARFQAEKGMTVTDLTEIAVKMPEIRLRAASSAPAFVVLDDGRRLLIGDRIRDDWMLASVSAQDVTFTRGNSTLRVPRR